MAKVYIVKDELYPCFFMVEKGPISVDIEVEEEELERWRKVLKDFAIMQKQIAEKYDVAFVYQLLRNMYRKEDGKFDHVKCGEFHLSVQADLRVHSEPNEGLDINEEWPKLNDYKTMEVAIFEEGFTKNWVIPYLDERLKGYKWSKLFAPSCGGNSSIAPNVDWETIKQIITDMVVLKGNR